MNLSAGDPVRRRVTAALVTIALALPMQRAAAAETPSSSPSIELALDLDAGLDSRAELFEKRVPHEFEERATAAAWAIEPRARMQVFVHVAPRNNSDIDYDFVVSSKLDGVELDDTRVVGTCEKCVEEDVVRKIEPALDEQFAALAAKLDEPSTAGVSPAPSPSTTTPGHDEPAVDARGDTKPRLGALGKAGIGVMVGGAAMLGAGLGVALAGGKSEIDPGDAQRDREQDLRIPGGVIAGVGGLALVAGIAMLAVDVRRNRKRRATLTPTVSLHTAGVVFRYAF